MDHSSHSHHQMDPSNHVAMDHSQMDHGQMDHSAMDHSTMDHSAMDHSTMDHSKMGHAGMDHGNMDMDMMKMYFHVGIEETILFHGWKTTNVAQLIGSCILLFVVALLYEGLKVFREELLVRANQELLLRNSPETLPTNDETGENGVGSDQVIIRSGPTRASRMLNKWHFLQSFLHIVQVRNRIGRSCALLLIVGTIYGLRISSSSEGDGVLHADAGLHDLQHLALLGCGSRSGSGLLLLRLEKTIHRGRE